ncbi:DMT family transporter [Actinocorallia longicatena]|uniref:DMT family transporter n=1 Tax=Actinocorallia longicatena TaxID=111803 RepID=A0ABP6QJL6_9ACTN
MLTYLAVLFAGLLHAVWNALVARPGGRTGKDAETASGSDDRYIAFAIIGLTSAVACAPLALFHVPALPAWPYVITSVVLHIGYTLLLIRCYTVGDFGQVYPIARGSAPLIVAAVATLLGEHLSLTQLLGLAAVCGGLGALAIAGRRGAPSRPALLAALGTGASIAAYTVVDGLGVRRAEGSLGYTAWLFLLEGGLVAAGVLAVKGGAVMAAPRRMWAMSATGGVVSTLAYGIVVWAQTRSPLAEVAALRETGVIWGAVIGAVFFAERLGRRRIAAAAVVALGVILLNAHPA